MAVIRDVMPVFELFQPASVADALTLVDTHGTDAWILAGGMDSFDWLKDRAKRVAVVVDLSQVSELRGIKEVDGGLEIGAMTTLTEVVRHPVVQAKFSILSQAAELVASPQIRNQGRSGATSARTRGAGITAAAGRATGRAGTSATRTRRRRSTGSTRFWGRTGAWR